jgi:hypothetical protein
MPKVTIQGKPDIINLDDRKDFKVQGGEARIYEKGGIIYKIYLEASKMIPLSKIQELSVLDKPTIIKPKEIVLDSKSGIIGFTMDSVKGQALAALFTNDFRNDNGITPESTLKLVEAIQESINYIHSKDCLVVDLNEMNILADEKDYQTPYFIDVNSYQTKSFRASAIAPGIRDWKTNTFNKVTDWFSYAILACELFIGIHPFEGKHPKYTSAQFKERVIDCISIFNSDSRVPKATRDFSLIPSEYMNWFIKLFEKGERIPPPAMAGLLNVTQVRIQLVHSTNNFIIQLFKEYITDIFKHFTFGGKSVVILKDKLLFDKDEFKISSHKIDVIFTPKMLRPVLAKINQDGFLDLMDLDSKQIINTGVLCSEKFVVNNVLFSRFEGQVTEWNINNYGNSVLCVVETIWDIMPKASQILDGVIYQNILGNSYFFIPVPAQGVSTSCYTKSIPELNNHRIINAKCEGRVLIVIADDLINYTQYNKKFVIRFDKNYDQYDIRILDCKTSQINFTVLDNGVCVNINEDDSLEAFHCNIGAKITRIEDPDISSDMTLTKSGVTVMFHLHEKLYTLKMK